jgi:hypothetical protein
MGTFGTETVPKSALTSAEGSDKKLEEELATANAATAAQKALKEAAEAELVEYEPGAWTPVTLPASVEAGTGGTPECRLLSSAKSPGKLFVEFQGATKVKAGKEVKTTETLFTVPAGFIPAGTRVTAPSTTSLSIAVTTGIAKPSVNQTEGLELVLTGFVYAL